MSVLLFPLKKAVPPARSIPFSYIAPQMQDAVLRAMQHLLILNAQAALHACEDCTCGLSQLGRMRQPVDAATLIADQCTRTAHRAALYAADLMTLSLAADSSFLPLTSTMQPCAGSAERITATVLRLVPRPTILH